MKLLKVISGYPPIFSAGSEIYSQTLCEELSRHHTVRVFTGDVDPYRAEFDLRRIEQSPTLKIHRVNLPRARDGIGQPGVDQALESILDEFEPDLAHIGHLFYLSMGVVDVLASRGLPIVFTLHDFWLMCPRGQFLQVNYGEAQVRRLCDGQDDRKCALRCFSASFPGQQDSDHPDVAYWTSWVSRRMAAARALCRKIDHFIAPSDSLRQRFVNHFGIDPGKITTLDCGYRRDRFHTVERRPQAAYRFAYIGTHSPAKGIDLLIKAFARIEEPAELFIWGQPRHQHSTALEAMAAASRQPIHFMGAYRNDDIASEVFSRIDCIVVPSIWTENSPLVIHEAQACRVPVITADVGGMAEYVHHEVNGLLFEHRDVEALTSTLTYAARNPDELERLGQRGYLGSPDGRIPDIETHCRELEAIYASVS